MSERGEEVERKSADPQHRISLAEAVAAAASNSASKHDFQSGSNPNSNMNMNTGNSFTGGNALSSNASDTMSEIANLNLQGLDAISILKLQLLQQHQHQQDEALLVAAGAGGSSSLFGSHGLLGNTPASRAGLEQVAYLQKQQLNMFRVQAEMLQQGNGLNAAEATAMVGRMPHQSDAAALRRHQAADASAKENSKKVPSYYDASQLPGPPSDDEEDVETSEEQHEKEKKKKGAYVETFPLKLFRMIDEAEGEGKEDVVSFFAHGRAFAIHKPRTFITEFMPRYFSTSRMSSFQRQLNLYGFRRIAEGRDKGGYFHEYFLKGRKGLCKRIKRKKTSTVKMAGNKGVVFNGGGLQGMGAGLFGAFGIHVAPGLQDAANLYQVQMLQAASGFNGHGGFGAAAGSLGHSDAAAHMNMGLNFMGASALRSPYGSGFGGLDPNAISALLEQKKTELLLTQMQQQMQQQMLQQQMLQQQQQQQRENNQS